MAKRPRMGRNLDALLGGASRERANTSNSQNASSEIAAEANTVSPMSPVTADSSVSAMPAVTAVPANRNSEPTTPAEALPGVVSKQTDTVDSPNTESTLAKDTVVSEPADRLQMISIDNIRRGTYQPRRLFDQTLLQELSDSIKAEGLIQPILVRPFAGAYELIAGERRWRAAQLAGLTELPAIVREMPDKTVAAVALIENIQRKDLNPLEEAAAFERLCDEFGMTHKAVAESVGRSRASVSNLLRLLELHDEVKVLVDKGEIEMGHARAILGAPKEQQFEIAQQVIDRGLTVRAVEKLVRELVDGPADKPVSSKQSVIDPDIERLSKKLGETLGASVKIQHKSTGAGKLEVSYSSVSELQGILAHIK